MRFNGRKMTYSLSEKDLTVLHQAKVGFQELTRVEPKQPGLPPLWSRLPYLMLLYQVPQSANHFWMVYREFDTLLKSRDRHYFHSYIPKNNGGTRALTVPDWYLRRHQKFILEHILNNLPVSDHACAYRKHRGLVDLAQPHVGHSTLLHLDIQDFFSSISEQTVFETLLKMTGYPKSVAGFLSHLCCYHGYLPQGACTSPALSNLCFLECDEEIAALAQRQGLVYTRYSDDLYLSGNGMDPAAVIQEVKEILARRGFRLRSDKTKVLGQHQTQSVTAITVNEKMQVSRAYRRKLRQEVYYLKRFQEDAHGVLKAACYEDYLYQLLGKISFVLYVDPENKEFREAKETVADMLGCCYYF